MAEIAVGARPETPAERELSDRLAEPSATAREQYLVDQIVQLRERLAAAEDALVMASWTPTGDSPRGKAVHELWLRWCRVSGFTSAPHEFPHLTDKLIDQLVVRRDATRKTTLDRLLLPPSNWVG